MADKSNYVNEFIESVKSSVDGVVAITVVELSSGMALGTFTNGTLDPDVASAYNVEVVKSKLKAIEALELDETIDDILITLSSQYHLIKCNPAGSHMIYLAAEKSKANLAMLRASLVKGMKSIEGNL